MATATFEKLVRIPRCENRIHEEVNLPRRSTFQAACWSISLYRRMLINNMNQSSKHKRQKMR
jgi:hypothetical protein